MAPTSQRFYKFCFPRRARDHLKVLSERSLACPELKCREKKAIFHELQAFQSHLSRVHKNIFDRYKILRAHVARAVQISISQNREPPHIANGIGLSPRSLRLPSDCAWLQNVVKRPPMSKRQEFQHLQEDISRPFAHTSAQNGVIPTSATGWVSGQYGCQILGGRGTNPRSKACKLVTLL